MATRADLVEQLLELPAVERAEAAHALLVSLHGEDDPKQVERAWRTEIQRRLQEVHDGSVELEDGPTVMRELRARARNRRRQ